MTTPRYLAAAWLTLPLAAGVVTCPAAAEPASDAAPLATSPSDWRYENLADPARVVVTDSVGAVATFTVGSRTVTMRGPKRTFAESTTDATVTTRTWVRLLRRPFTGSVNDEWLTRVLADRSPDLLAVTTEYVTDAVDRTDGDGMRYAGDASYGPLQADGTRQEGSDFNDYLGMPWTYPSATDSPEAAQFGALDCSGFVRMVFGYRFPIPLTLAPDGDALPRRAAQMLDSAPGVVVIANTGRRPSSRTAALQPGDLLFFDGSTDDGTAVDHVGVFLGRDSNGDARFVSSRKTVDGPTFGDVGGRSVLTGTGYYAMAFRAARRL